MIEIRIEKSKGGIYTANYDGGWNMQISKDEVISQAKKILKKRGYSEDEIMIVDTKE